MKNRSLNTSYSKKKSIIFAKSNIFANISTGLLISHMVRGIDELKWSLKILSCLYLKLFCNIFSKFAKWLPVPVPIQCTLRYHIEPLGERGLCKLLFVYIYKKYLVVCPESTRIRFVFSYISLVLSLSV